MKLSRTLVTSGVVLLVCAPLVGCGEKADAKAQAPDATSTPSTGSAASQPSSPATAAKTGASLPASAKPNGLVANKPQGLVGNPGTIADGLKSLGVGTSGGPAVDPRSKTAVPTPSVEAPQTTPSLPSMPECQRVLAQMSKSLDAAHSVKSQQTTMVNGKAQGVEVVLTERGKNFHHIARGEGRPHEKIRINSDVYISLDSMGIRFAFVTRSKTIPAELVQRYDGKWLDLQHPDGGAPLKNLVQFGMQLPMGMSPFDENFRHFFHPGCDVATESNGQVKLIWPKGTGYALLEPAPSYLPVVMEYTNNLDSDSSGEQLPATRTQFSEWNSVKPIQRPAADALMSPLAFRKSVYGIE